MHALSLAEGVALVEAVRHGRLVTIPGARHPSYLDAPERFHAELLDFVRR